MACTVLADDRKIYVKSEQIKVFPCAGRGNSSTIYDPEARLNTEYNAINHISTNGFARTCILLWDTEAGIRTTRFVIDGYTFEIKDLDLEKDLHTNESPDKHLEYAVIQLGVVKLVETADLTDGSKTTRMLTSWNPGNGPILDTLVTAGQSGFTGLTFMTAAEYNKVKNDPKTRAIQLIKNGKINQKLYLPVILNGDGKHSIVLGTGTTASLDNQLTIGQYNKPVEDALFVVGNGADEKNLSNAFVVNKTGNLSISADLKCRSLTETSDRRLKENIEEFKPNTEKSILDLPIYKYTYKDDPSQKPHIGFMAQDVQEICPEIVVEDHDGYLAIENSKLIYLLLQEIKDLKAKIS